MEKDFRLEDIFDAYRPDLDDGTEFMATLQHKLEAADYLRAMREAERRHCRRMTLAALVAGLVLGGMLMAALLLLPYDIPVSSLVLPGLAAVLSQEVTRLVCTVLASVLAGCLVIAIVHLLDTERSTPLPYPKGQK